MTSPSQRQTILETILMLAEEISRAAPECADKAMRIADLVRELEPAADRSVIQDAIETETVGSDVSDSQVRNATSAVVRAIRSP